MGFNSGFKGLRRTGKYSNNYAYLTSAVDWGERTALQTGRLTTGVSTPGTNCMRGCETQEYFWTRDLGREIMSHFSEFGKTLKALFCLTDSSLKASYNYREWQQHTLNEFP